MAKNKANESFVATFLDGTENAGGFVAIRAAGFYTALDKISDKGYYQDIESIQRLIVDDEFGQFFPKGCIDKL